MVLIDMEKPEDCLDCPFINNYTNDCSLRQKEDQVGTFEEQYKRCPIREVQG